MPPMLFPVVALAVLCLYSDGFVETKEPGLIGVRIPSPTEWVCTWKFELFL